MGSTKYFSNLSITRKIDMKLSKTQNLYCLDSCSRLENAGCKCMPLGYRLSCIRDTWYQGTKYPDSADGIRQRKPSTCVCQWSLKFPNRTLLLLTHHTTCGCEKHQLPVLTDITICQRLLHSTSGNQNPIQNDANHTLTFRCISYERNRTEITY